MGRLSDRSKDVVTYGLTAALFIFGWIVLGTMLLLNQIFGGAQIDFPERGEEGEKGVPPRGREAEAA